MAKRASETENQLAAYTYDAAGNVLIDQTNYYSIDSESRICAFKNGNDSYLNVYDASSHLVEKGVIANYQNCIPSTGAGGNSFSATSQTVLGLGGEQFAEWTPAGWATNVYANGQLLATYQGSQLYFALNDRLGTKRVLADVNATSGLGQYVQGFYNLPFGDNFGPAGGTDPSTQHFTGKEKDVHSGLDYFGARFYSSIMGRFMSPDWATKPEAVPYSDLSNPQSLNLYGYVNNNPLSNVDPDGHFLGSAAGDCVGNERTGESSGACSEQQAKSFKDQAQKSVAIDSLVAQQNVGTQKVGGQTVNEMTNVLTNESRDLTGGKPGDLDAGKIAEANAIINNNLLKHPGQEASDLLSKGAAASAGRSDDENIMRQAYLDRLAGKPDPVAGRTYFGNSAENLKSRPIGNGRQTVFAQYGPFDHGSGPKQYIYIYNDPVLNH